MLSSLATRGWRHTLVALFVVAVGGCGPSGSPSPSSSGPAIAVLGAENFYADLLAPIGGAAAFVGTTFFGPPARPPPNQEKPPAAHHAPPSKLRDERGRPPNALM